MLGPIAGLVLVVKQTDTGQPLGGRVVAVDY